MWCGGERAAMDEDHVKNVVSSERRDDLSKSSEWVKNPNSATSEGKHVSTLSTQRDRPGREARVRLLSSVPQETHWDCGHHKHHSRVQQEHRARRRSRRYLRKRHQRSPQDRPVGHHRQHLPLLRFSQPEYHLTLREDVPIHTSILTVGVEGAGATLTYHVSDTVNFAIDDAGVIYILRQLDHEGTGGHYTLKVTAEEQGGGWQWPRPAAKVNIQVTDAPEPPHFDSEHYQFTVSEFARAGSYVGTVRASDDDGDLDRYFLHGAELTEAQFSIDVESGVITLNEAPDGTRWEFHLQAGASDRQGHVALVPVSVYVLTSNPSYGHLVSVDQGNNGHRPAFRDCEDYDDIHVMENVTAGSPVLTVVATDEDNGPSGFIAYSLIHSFSSFAIQALNRQGKITTTRRLDRDEGDVEFLLTVVAKDGGSPPSRPPAPSG
ncbi:neural-cadherin-like [Scylla paramamosain]|uniref:neural-cadherin-like n=1 Tax=Scylla paramamosain TaxID=85552 RepID=UPI003082D291